MATQKVIWIYKGQFLNERRYCATPDECTDTLLNALSTQEKLCINRKGLIAVLRKMKVNKDIRILSRSIEKATLFGGS